MVGILSYTGDGGAYDCPMACSALVAGERPLMRRCRRSKHTQLRTSCANDFSSSPPVRPMTASGMLRPSTKSTPCRGMYGPAARLKMISELGEREKLHQCIRPLEWSSSRSGPRWASARIQGSLPERLLRAKSLPSLMAAPGRPFVHLFMSSSRPRWETVELCLVYCASFAACRVT